MQSGITASQELHTAFKTFVSTESQRGLLCTITGETLTPSAILEPSTSSFDNDLDLLAPHLQDKAALYIILRRYPSNDPAPFVAITYVPDSAPVRQKMLFASTRLTLEELTKEGFAKHDKHVKLAAPLTEEEQSLGEVKRKEAEEGRGMNERKSHVSSGISMPATPEALEALKGLNQDGAHNLVQIKMNIAKETMELASKTQTSISEISSTISATEPRFSFYRYTHDHNGSTSSPILFIYTCPSGSKIKERMIYASSSRSAQQLAESEAGLTIEKRLEAGSPEDISQESIDSDLHPKTEVKKTFARPKRPGRA
ncbi:cofilin/tropomyosin-type actin-binding protein [Botrytis cinerea]